ncbi:two-component regulator propeller domain-containing protein [Oceanimonas sp. CHS3-5]|uniref:ligand-binding sensor domain-containing diguanylate cyclase n=1 Tax=Oceanimonas sp. CHS3-5 TaxID=3068186 RepID=UPI00273D933D|nr:ligand-binding sensor domain-containing diguanylate cyclase [Oceanimonas sp. CHS3-5]MDP5291635.1 two-component regulator propeller domain-containing protein [Oceanimonas sp. CHS3-5]
MRLCRLLLPACLCCLLLAWPVAAADSPLKDYYQDSWNTRNGLPHNSINSMAQTPEGYLWFATWEGVSRYNGRGFHTFVRGEQTGLPDSGIRGLTLDGDGLLVAGARGGFSRYQHPGWQPRASLPAMVNHVLRDRQGRLWFATEGDGIYMRDAEGQQHHFSSPQGLPGLAVYRLLQTTDGRIWAGTSQGLAVIGAGQKITVSEQIPAVPVLALLQTRKGQLLVGSGRGLYGSDEHGGFAQLHPQLAGEAISSLLQDSAGDLWIGTTDRGLVRLGSYGLERMGMAQGLPDNRVLSLLQDTEDNIWVGTNGGLLRLRDAPFTSFTQEQGLSGNYVRTVLADDKGRIWVGTSNGLSLINASGVRPLPVKLPDGKAPSILSLARQGNTLWLGTYTHGLVGLKPGREPVIIDRKQGLSADEVRAILPARDGSLWVGTASGLSRLHQGRVTTYGKQDGLPGEFVMALHQANNGDIWVGTGVGAAIIRQGNPAHIRALDLHSQENAEYAFGFYQQPGSDAVWIATDRGLLRYRYRDDSLSMVGRPQGLPIEKMFQPVADQQGGLWLTTNRGILRLDLQQAHRAADGELDTIPFELFGEGDGIASSQANGGSGPAATLAPDGSVWIATAVGVARVQPNRLASLVPNNLPVVLEDIRVNGMAVMPTQPLTLPAGSDRIQIEFAGLGYVMPERIRYRTRLEGFDKEWVARGGQNLAEYTNLAPGHYRLKVAASYPYSSWSHREASLSFSIAPFFWQRPVFWGLVGVVGLWLIWALFQLRLRMLKRNASTLRRLVDEKTQALQQQTQAFERQAREDQLTGLANRRAFDDWLATAYGQVDPGGNGLCLAVVDIDHFKRVNDQWSHNVGDEAITAVARVLRVQVRAQDKVARWGGEEFTLLFPDTSLKDATRICERIRQAVAELDCSPIAEGLSLTISLGLADAGGAGSTDRLLAQADQALYRAKNNGRNRVEVWS